MPFGLNTDVERGERVFHVQTEAVNRDDPAVQTLIFAGGEVLVRMTVACADLTAADELRDDDIRHVLELQHWNLVRKIQHGMLDGGVVAGSVDLRSRLAEQDRDDPGADRELAGAEPGVRELLEELERRISRAASAAPPREPSGAPTLPRLEESSPALGWWRRVVGRIVLILRW